MIVPLGTVILILFVQNSIVRLHEGGRTFAVTTSQLWNTLNLELRKLESLSVFKKKYLNSIFETQQQLSHFTV